MTGFHVIYDNGIFIEARKLFEYNKILKLNIYIYIYTRTKIKVVLWTSSLICLEFWGHIVAGAGLPACSGKPYLL